MSDMKTQNAPIADAVSNDNTLTAEENKESTVEKEQPKKKLIPTNVDVHQYITVKNGFQGVLVYVSTRTGEQFIWNEFGAEQDMELQELKSAKSSSKKFFENNWFMFDDDWVIEYLGVGRYYKDAISIDRFDELFSMEPDKIVKTVSKLSDGQKRSVAYRARQLIAEGQIDSNKAIAALEKSLGVKLVEK